MTDHTHGWEYSCEYNPDHDIELYNDAELRAMLGYYDGTCWTIPPFSEDEIRAELIDRDNKRDLAKNQE
jgi:hypothetical protein